jgi:hypothetical protein
MPEARVRSDDPRRALALVVVAFGLRLAWGLAAGVTPGGESFDDAAWYHHTAITLARGGGYLSPFTAHPTAAWPPGYPLVLALGYMLAGAGPTTAVVMNAVFGALTCGFVWQLGSTLAGRRSGLVATALTAFFPSHVFFSALVLSETLFTCLVTGLMLAAVRRLARGDDTGVGGWLVWGLAAGAVALVRAEAVVLTLVPALSLAVRGARGASRRVLAATLVGVVIALAPWTLRNLRVFDAFVPTSTGAGRTLWIGHNPHATGGMDHTIQAAMIGEIVAAGLGLTYPSPADELAVDRLLRGQALRFAATHPARELALTPLRAYHLFRGDTSGKSGTSRERACPAVSGGAPHARRDQQPLLWRRARRALVGLIVRPAEPAAGWRVLDVLMLVWIAIFTLIYAIRASSRAHAARPCSRPWHWCGSPVEARRRARCGPRGLSRASPRSSWSRAAPSPRSSPPPT